MSRNSKEVLHSDEIARAASASNANASLEAFKRSLEECPECLELLGDSVVSVFNTAARLENLYVSAGVLVKSIFNKLYGLFDGTIEEKKAKIKEMFLPKNGITLSSFINSYITKIERGDIDLPKENILTENVKILRPFLTDLIEHFRSRAKNSNIIQFSADDLIFCRPELLLHSPEELCKKVNILKKILEREKSIIDIIPEAEDEEDLLELRICNAVLGWLDRVDASGVQIDASEMQASRNNGDPYIHQSECPITSISRERNHAIDNLVSFDTNGTWIINLGSDRENAYQLVNKIIAFPDDKYCVIPDDINCAIKIGESKWYLPSRTERDVPEDVDAVYSRDGGEWILGDNISEEDFNVIAGYIPCRREDVRK